jgi:hypothetical protein
MLMSSVILTTDSFRIKTSARNAETDGQDKFLASQIGKRGSRNVYVTHTGGRYFGTLKGKVLISGVVSRNLKTYMKETTRNLNRPIIAMSQLSNFADTAKFLRHGE